MAAGAGLPHDLAQYVVEATFGVTTGFWGLVARGATFKSTGRRITKPGRALVVAHRASLDAAERLAGEHVVPMARGPADGGRGTAVRRAGRLAAARARRQAWSSTWPRADGRHRRPTPDSGTARHHLS